MSMNCQATLWPPACQLIQPKASTIAETAKTESDARPRARKNRAPALSSHWADVGTK
jgi:hypothetical protein